MDEDVEEIAVEDFIFQVTTAENEFNKEKKSLFATHIWTGARVLSNFLRSEYQTEVIGKSVIEFGSAAGLPSLVCNRLGARNICASDYPSPCVIENLNFNFLREGMTRITPTSDLPTNPCHFQYNFNGTPCDRSVIGYLWGEDESKLLEVNGGEKYDLALAAECLWKHENHEILIDSLQKVLKPQGRALIVFSHHHPGMEAADLKFFEDASPFFQIIQQREFQGKHMWSDRIVPLFLYEMERR